LKKLIAVVFSFALLSWPGNFGSTGAVLAGELPLVEAQDIQDAGQFQVFVVTGVSAKRLMNKYNSTVLINFDQKIVFLLRIEA